MMQPYLLLAVALPAGAESCRLIAGVYLTLPERVDWQPNAFTNYLATGSVLYITPIQNCLGISPTH